MPLRHPEYHFGQSDAAKDVVIGSADGLTAPFALAAGLAGAVPLRLYRFMASLREALAVSCGVTLATLPAFDGIKGKLAGVSPLRAALQTMVVGGVAAAIAFAVAQMLS